MKLHVLLFLLPATLLAQAPKGIWDAAVTQEGQPVAFRLEFGGGTPLRGAILDGEKRIWSSSGVFANGSLELRWDYFDSNLKASMENGVLKGAYTRRKRTGPVTLPFTAKPFQPPVPSEVKPAQFAGLWRLQTDAERGVRVMDGRFRQSGDQVTGTIQRIDGDFGTLSGQVNGNHLVLTHFDGIRATRVEAEMQADGTLRGLTVGGPKFRGVRAEKATQMGIPEPPDPTHYIAVKNPAEPFAFQFEDLDGKPVSLSDATFRGKAVIVTITGSWCPNCHDEAPFLLDLYRKYHAKGLEIVSLGFEYTGEIERDRTQLRAFARLQNIPWTVLLAGTTEDGEVQRKLPQLASFGAFPTTLFLGRDHRVEAVHAGFAGPANPEEHRKLKEETESLVKKLLQ
ncbi:TlpA disulfide reductase family protein [uncultured Paludibaculum sp.]|uniref:peroxiredoxin family protein n=1 Tax=uncultured Paludibaculum sp. TaxID=1765020 RepID=UPI002AAAD963|nr:TlpA disulfide reductase family protein [uncultured Paludibaculum sp.]